MTIEARMLTMASPKTPVGASDGTVLPGTDEVRSQMREARRQKLQTRNWKPESKNQRAAEHHELRRTTVGGLIALLGALY